MLLIIHTTAEELHNLYHSPNIVNGDRIEEDEMVEACSTRKVDEKRV
jgi:hypothetical protein